MTSKETSTDKVAESFFTQIKSVMKAQKISQADLARSLGCSRANVNQMFDRDNLTVGTMSKIVDALGVELYFVLKKKDGDLTTPEACGFDDCVLPKGHNGSHKPKRRWTAEEEHGMAQTSAYVVLQRGPCKVVDVCKYTGLVEIRAKKALEDLVKRKMVRKSGGVYFRID